MEISSGELFQWSQVIMLLRILTDSTSITTVLFVGIGGCVKWEFLEVHGQVHCIADVELQLVSCT